MRKKTKKTIENIIKLSVIVALIIFLAIFAYNKTEKDLSPGAEIEKKAIIQDEKILESFEEKSELTTYSIDGHELRETLNGIIVHSNTCKECLKATEIQLKENVEIGNYEYFKK